MNTKSKRKCPRYNMCRYERWDNPYSRHMACLECGLFYHDKDVCDQCKQNTVSMGPDFKPPRKEDKKQWRKVKLLYKNGIKFTSCGCSGPGWRPATLAEAKDYLSNRERLKQAEPLVPRSRYKKRW